MQTNPWDPEGAAVVLDPHGRVCAEIGGSLPDLEALYQLLLSARSLDEQLAQACETWVSASGEEAPLIALGLVARAGELVFSGFRDHALVLARELALETAATALLRERNTGDTSFYGPLGIVPPGPSLGGHLAFAAGASMAAKTLGDGRATFVSFGEGVTTTGLYYEALMAAASGDLPLVFVCRSQLWPDAAPAEAGLVGDCVADRARSCGLWTRRVDGADPVAVYSALRNAATRAREGRGPALIEAVVTPLRRNPPPHRDPLERLRRHLEQANLWTPSFQAELEAGITTRLHAALHGV